MNSIAAREEDEAMAQASAWLARLQRADLGEADGLEFDAWLAAAPANALAYRRALATWQAFEAGADDIVAELAESVRPPRLPMRSRASPARRWVMGAGAMAIAAGLGLAVLPPMLSQAPLQTYQTGKGEHRRIALADGSVIDLNAETRLSVRLGRSARQVMLGEGEAIFDVASDKARPFTVAAGDRVVRVVGTQFDVRNRQGALTVTVARGRVQVRPAQAQAGERSFLLTPGERLAVARSGVEELKVVDPQETFGWRAGRLVFRNQPLSDVVAELNRQYAAQIEISDPELGDSPITGVIVLDDQRSVIARLSLMLPIRSVPSDRGLLLLRK